MTFNEEAGSISYMAGPDECTMILNAIYSDMFCVKDSREEHVLGADDICCDAHPASLASINSNESNINQSR